MLAKTKVLVDKEGNRYIIPSFIIYPNDEDRLSEYDVDCRVRMIAMRIYDFTVEPNMFEFDSNHFPHFSVDIGSRAFIHGAATFYLFAGPAFDRIMNKED